ncbi:MAG: FkbM family methyltransferase [Kiritimatiellales bacterium]|nr:FkbM family methyltransferase [Kiritimatiellales bacterium]MCF7863324.1 FkbM family methyltransferase [Kiritimatiellales bacterium]
MGLEQTNLYWYLKRKRRKHNIRKDGHSQYGQDTTVFDLLGQPANGVFLDIGANDGVSLSNTLLFEEKGWSGVCVEPHPVMFEQLKENRNCHLLNACISGSDGMVGFLVVEGYANMLSGIAEFIDEHHIKRIDNDIAEHGGSKRTVEIEALAPHSLLKRFGIDRVDYLSIDTEGCELAILKNFDFKQIPVQIIGVENGTRSPELFRYMCSIGYELVKCVGCDEIYRRK